MYVNNKELSPTEEKRFLKKKVKKLIAAIQNPAKWIELKCENAMCNALDKKSTASELEFKINTMTSLTVEFRTIEYLINLFEIGVTKDICRLVKIQYKKVILSMKNLLSIFEMKFECDMSDLVKSRLVCIEYEFNDLLNLLARCASIN
jgi:hypothetical protein